MILIETRAFAREREALLNAEEFRALQNDLLMHPERGDVIRGSGGARKARLKMRGRGKSGGGRVIYFYYVAASRLYLLDCYSKSDEADLTPEQVSRLRRVIEAIRREKLL